MEEKGYRLIAKVIEGVRFVDGESGCVRRRKFLDMLKLSHNYLEYHAFVLSVTYDWRYVR